MQEHDGWAELKVSVPKTQADLAAQCLIEQGSNGVVEEDAAGDPQGATVLKGYLPCDGQLEARLDRIRSDLDRLACNARLELSVIPDEDWNEKWKSFFEPIRVTRRFVVKPSWKSFWPRADDIVIELDPAMAFGTGTHPSTRMCLQAIEDYADACDGPASASMLDVGTGSGILAIAAALRGMHPVVAIDNDRTAIACAVKNAAHNGVAGRVSLSSTPPGRVDGSFDLVAANILPHVLIAMRDDLTARMRDGAVLVLSGILTGKASEVMAAFAEKVTFVRQMTEQEWCCLVFRKK